MTRKRGKIKNNPKSDSSQKSEDELLYCICRSADGTRFMIACDNCEEWYHGDCINVTPKQANNIKRFYCHLCIGRNPGLEIEYKTLKETRPRLPNLRQQIKKINFSSDDENDADMSSTSTPDKSFPSAKSKRSNRKRLRNSSESGRNPIISSSNNPTSNVITTTKKRRGRPRERPDDFDEEATEDEMETAGIAPSLNECTPMGIVDDPGETSIYNKKAYRRQILYDRSTVAERKGCGSCDGCKSTVNCGKCDICMKNTSTGLINTRYVCKKRMCYRLHGNLRPTIDQYSKDFNHMFEDDYDDVLEERSFSRQNNIQNRPEYDIREIRQRLMNHTNKSITSSATIGSKMRRGDHLPGGGNNNTNRRLVAGSGNSSSSSAIAPNVGVGTGTNVIVGSSNNQSAVNFKYLHEDNGIDLANGTSVSVTPNSVYRYQNAPTSRLSRNQTNSSVPQRRLRNQPDPGILPNDTSPVNIHSSHQMNYDDSDEDVMIPSEFMSPRRQISDPDNRNYLQYQKGSRSNVNNDSNKYIYGLSYPDHLYCKNHRYLNWHNSENVPSDSLTLRSESSVRTDEKEIEISHTSLSPNIHDLSPNTPYLLDRQSTIKSQHCASNIHHKPLMKPPTHDNDRSTLSDSNVYIYNTNQTAYPIVDLNQHITHEIALVSSQSQIDTVPHSSTSVFSKALVANAQSQEFYTINDDDSLEINWPKETVNV